MNEVNLVSPVNSVSVVPTFMNHTLHHQPTVVKELEEHVGKLCFIKPVNSMRKDYIALDCITEADAVREMRTLAQGNKFMQETGSRFVLLEVCIDPRKNILLKCLSAEPATTNTNHPVYWLPFYSRNMKISVIPEE